jgi:hypothetical protein
LPTRRSTQERLLQDRFFTTWANVVPGGRLIFGDFMEAGADPRVYAPITDMERLVKVRHHQRD